MRRYQLLIMFARYGRILAAAIVVAIILADMGAVLAATIGWILGIAVVAAGLLLGLAVLVFVDLARVIVDMMVPQID